MNPTGTTNPTDLADRYFEIWNETDPARRAELVAASWSADGLYVDPLFEARGHTALSDLVAGAHQLFPGHRFTRTGTIDHHHDRIRWSWELAAPGAAPVAGGTDIVTLTPDGRLAEVIGFHDFAPGS